ncbi:MAG: transposase [Breznakia sp.]
MNIIEGNPTPYNAELIIEVIDDIYSKEERIKKVESRLEKLIEQTGYKLTTIPGVSIATASMLISEIGDINRFKNDNKLAPVAIGSAGKNTMSHSKSGNRILRSTMYFLAVGMISTTVHKEAKQPYFRDYFLNKTQNGKTKQQALLCITRQLIRVIYSMMKYKREWRQPEYK